ncbi:hypothetical protein HUC15_22430 [Escherichia coli]|nr:hypothetical protein [Escherichia coli]
MASTNRSCDRWGTWLFERFQGQNRIVTPGALTHNFIPEDASPNAQSPLTNHYIPILDDTLAYSTLRKTSPTTSTLYVNGVVSTMTNPGRMFDAVMSNFASTQSLNSGDYFDLVIDVPSSLSVRICGFSFGELTWATSFTPRIRMYDSSLAVIYDKSFSQGNAITTGYIEVSGVRRITLSVSGLVGSGVFPICRAYAKTSNATGSSLVNPIGSVPFVSDVTIDKDNGGLILWTPDGTKKYKISLSNGGSVISTLIT